MRLLLVDDYRPFGLSLQALLAPAHETILAASGEEALRLLSMKPFDAALIDLRLPDMNGVELCERVRADGVRLPNGIVATTGGGADRETRTRLAKISVPIVEKPFTPDQLLGLLSPR